MNKREFVDYVAENYDATKKESADWVDVFIDALKNAVVEHGEVNLYGFGKFKTIVRKGRTYYDINSKTTKYRDKKPVIRFYPAMLLTSEVGERCNEDDN